MNNYLTLEHRDDIGIVWIDHPTNKVNTLSQQAAAEWQKMLAQIEGDPALKAAIFISRKPNNFIAGADIEEFQSFRNAKEGEELSRFAQTLMDKIANSPKLCVAAIHGSCLGGGLELALACHYRIATDDPQTIFGLPEVSLGVLPAAGGTQRLPRLIGLPPALHMLLTGKRVRAVEAKRLGLIDSVVVTDGFANTAVLATKQVLAKRHPRALSFIQKLELLTPLRQIILAQAKKQALQKSGGHYPAPEAILDAVSVGLARGLPAGLRVEAKQFGALLQTNVAQNLIRLFFLQSSHKKSNLKDDKPSHVGVIGAGFMGAGIAQVSLQHGYDVILHDVKEDMLIRSEKQIWDAVQNQRLISKLHTETDFSHFGKCDVVIEAIFEDLKLKQKLLRELEPHLKDDCVFASNTSALPISSIAEHSTRKSQIIGMHYFSPVPKMPLLEIVRTKETSARTLAIATEIGFQQGKTMIVVNDGPGFYTSRILAPVMDEAIVLALEGVPLKEIDQTFQSFGFPVGPITLMDEVGIDVAGHVAKALTAFFGARMTGAKWEAMEELLRRNILGRKTKRGFYVYDKDAKHKKINTEVQLILLKHRQPSKTVSKREEIQSRIVLRMINEAVYCLQENILQSPEDGDVGAVFGLGFPPFLGGPFRYLDKIGAKHMLSELEALRNKFGERFAPAPLLMDMAAR